MLLDSQGSYSTQSLWTILFSTSSLSSLCACSQSVLSLQTISALNSCLLEYTLIFFLHIFPRIFADIKLWKTNQQTSLKDKMRHSFVKRCIYYSLCWHLVHIHANMAASCVFTLFGDKIDTWRTQVRSHHCDHTQMQILYSNVNIEW